ncbi:hypothetical protein ACTXT7_004088 [Hymenolepis weldensis]
MRAQHLTLHLLLSCPPPPPGMVLTYAFACVLFSGVGFFSPYCARSQKSTESLACWTKSHRCPQRNTLPLSACDLSLSLRRYKSFRIISIYHCSVEYYYAFADGLNWTQLFSAFSCYPPGVGGDYIGANLVQPDLTSAVDHSHLWIYADEYWIDDL